MEFSNTHDYSSVPTSELERLYAHAVRPEEKRAIEQELDRRYRYTEPARQPSVSGRIGQPRPPTEKNDESRPKSDYRPPPRPANGPISQPHYRSAPQVMRTQQVRGRGLGRINTLAVVSLALSIFWIYWLGSIAGLIIGFIALKQIRARNQTGRGLAIAGIIIGGASLALIVLIVGSQQ